MMSVQECNPDVQYQIKHGVLFTIAALYDTLRSEQKQFRHLPTDMSKSGLELVVEFLRMWESKTLFSNPQKIINLQQRFAQFFEECRYLQAQGTDAQPLVVREACAILEQKFERPLFALFGSILRWHELREVWNAHYERQFGHFYTDKKKN